MQHQMVETQVSRGLLQSVEVVEEVLMYPAQTVVRLVAEVVAMHPSAVL